MILWFGCDNLKCLYFIYFVLRTQQNLPISLVMSSLNQNTEHYTNLLFFFLFFAEIVVWRMFKDWSISCRVREKEAMTELSLLIFLQIKKKKEWLCPSPLSFPISECYSSTVVVILITELPYLSVLDSFHCCCTILYITITQHKYNALHYIYQS